MKILQINAYYGDGSTGNIVKDLYLYQKSNGIDSYVIYGKNYKKTEKNIMFCGYKYSFIIHKILYHIFGNALGYSYISTKSIIKKIDKIKPDIIHLHNLHDYYININLLFDYIIKNNIKVVWTFHDCWAYTGHCCHYKPIDCQKWQTECYNCPLQRMGPRSMIFDRSKEFYDKKRKLFNAVNNLNIVCVSNWLQNETSKSFLNVHKISTIYNWIDVKSFYPEENNLVSEMKKKLGIVNKFVILGVSYNWTEQKGIYDFIEIANKIDDNQVIVLVGNNINKKKYDKRNVYELPSNIILLPPTTDKNLLRLYYSMSDVFINPSRVETFGLTTAEALACGTPAIVYNNSASPEVVGTDGLCGEVIKYDDNRISYIMNYIKTIKKNSKSYYAQNCINKVNKFFVNNFEKYIRLYSEILKVKNGDVNGKSNS